MVVMSRVVVVMVHVMVVMVVTSTGSRILACDEGWEREVLRIWGPHTQVRSSSWVRDELWW